MRNKLIKKKKVKYLFLGGLATSVKGAMAGAGKAGGGLDFASMFKGFSGQSLTPDAKGLAPTKGAMANAAIGGGAMGALKGIGEFMNINASGMNDTQKTMAKADAGVGIAADIAGNFGPVGQAVGAGLNLINQFGGMAIKTPKAIKDFSTNDTVSASSSFGGVNELGSQTKDSTESFKTAGLAGKLFGKKNLMKDISKSNMQMNQSSQILNTNQKALDAASASSDMFSARNNFKLNNNGAFTNGSVQFGQQGMKVGSRTAEDYKKLGVAAKQLNLKKINKGIKKAQQGIKIEPVIVPEFKDGGVIEKNVIANGMLHARTHDLKSIEEFADADITLKGIPVITKDADSGIIQHAEIESSELILHLKLTKELESLFDEGTEEAMVVAGKLLSKEIVKNTKDNVEKLLKTIE